MNAARKDAIVFATAGWAQRPIIRRDGEQLGICRDLNRRICNRGGPSWESGSGRLSPLEAAGGKEQRHQYPPRLVVLQGLRTSLDGFPKGALNCGDCDADPLVIGSVE